MSEVTKPETVTGEQVRFTAQQLAETLLKEGFLQIQPEQTLIVQQIELSDFLSLVEEVDVTKKLTMFSEILKRFSVEIGWEGSMEIGAFNLPDQSWSFKPGASGFLRLHAKPALMKKSLKEIVSFLLKLPEGQALLLKPRQNLFLEGISADAMLDYYQHCQDESDPVAREKGQDEMFSSSHSLLAEKNMTLKVYGLNAKQVDRTIDAGSGGMLFTPVGSDELKEPAIVVGLVKKS